MRITCWKYSLKGLLPNAVNSSCSAHIVSSIWACNICPVFKKICAPGNGYHTTYCCANTAVEDGGTVKWTGVSKHSKQFAEKRATTFTSKEATVLATKIIVTPTRHCIGTQRVFGQRLKNCSKYCTERKTVLVCSYKPCLCGKMHLVLWTCLH